MSSNLDKGWAERAGKATAESEKNKPAGTTLTRPEWWSPGLFLPGARQQKTSPRSVTPTRKVSR